MAGKAEARLREAAALRREKYAAGKREAPIPRVKYAGRPAAAVVQMATRWRWRVCLVTPQALQGLLDFGVFGV